jgi:hypothetical protein
MIARGFKSVLWVATVGAAALGCYMVSLRVATERNELARVERQIVAAKREIRSLETELGTRGRLSQLEQWNAEVLALSAPGSGQFLKSEVTLARLDSRGPGLEERAADVRLASLEAPAAKPAENSAPAASAMVRAVAPAPAEPAPAAIVRRASFASLAPPQRPAPAAAKPAAPAKREAAPAPKEPKPARLDSTLAAEVGAAANAEDKASGGN